MSTTNRKGKAVIVRHSGFADDYVAANKTEILEAEDPVTEDMVRGDEGVAHRFRRRGPVTRAIRQPHASYMLGTQNDVYMVELEKLQQKQRELGPELMRSEDMTRLRELNEMINRNLREEREQVKLQRFEDMDREDMREALIAELEALEAESGDE